MFHLVIHNDTDAPVEVEVSIKGRESYDSKSGHYRISSGAFVNGVGWFGEPPLSVTVKTKENGHTFLPSEFPDAMQQRSSAGCPIHLRISPSEMRLENPTFLEGNQANIAFLGVCCGFPTVGGMLLWWLIATTLRRKRQV